MRQFAEPQHLVVFTDSDSIRNANKKLQETMNTKNLTETITIYNTKQPVDNMNKNEVLYIIFLDLVDEDLFELIKEKFDLKAEVEDDFIKEKKENIIEMDKSITDENEDETSLKGIEGDNIHDFATLPNYTKSQTVYDTIDLDHRHDAGRQQSRRHCDQDNFLELNHTVAIRDYSSYGRQNS